MQTFLSYADFHESARALDRTRLGNQAYRECKTLVNGGWPSHPASIMWRGHESSLCDYAMACLYELNRRGFHYPRHFSWFVEKKHEFPDTGKPPWIGGEIHARHRAILLGKAVEQVREAFNHTDLEQIMREKFSATWTTRQTRVWKVFMWYRDRMWEEEPATRTEDGKWPYIWPTIEETTDLTRREIDG